MDAASFPHAEISNSLIRAVLLLPDPERGYYRATRFDWSGLIASLECEGHNYFGPWFARHDPKTHDAVVGPVEEFQSDEGGPGYRDARAGGAFVRIGAGILRKPNEPEYRRFGSYDIEDAGKWAVRCERDRAEFVHELTHASGYGYVYRKTLRLGADAPELFLEHSLKNTGRRRIETHQYNHNFFVIDGQPSGPDFQIELPFEARAVDDLKGIVEVRGRQLRYVRTLEKGESVLTSLEGFRSTAADYDIRIANRRTGAAVRIQGDRPLAKLVFWSIRTTLCPEPYILLSLAPGEETRWTIKYTFRSLPPAADRDCTPSRRFTGSESSF